MLQLVHTYVHVNVVHNKLLLYVYVQFYGSRNLAGLKIEHKPEAFRDGMDTVLTLKDKG